MTPNVEQQACIDAHYGTYVVVSGPGSGKTTTLINRYFSMLISGIPSSDMLNLTFTHSAAEQMTAKAGILKEDSIFRTFHSFALDMLKKERTHLPFQLSSTIIPVQMEDYQLLFDLVKTYPAIPNFRLLKERLSDWKKKNIQPDEALEKAIGNEYFYARAYMDYETECRSQGWLDFDSFMFEAVKLLSNNEEVRNKYKRKFISVDECQDTDPVQFRMLQLLFDGNIFAVGDENQLIYEWRSAQSGNLTNFATLFPGAKTLYLGQNYRSTKRLVEFFKKILPIDNGIASHMFTENEEGIDPEIVKYHNDQMEAEKVLEKIIDPENSAVIARTNRQLFVFQKLCTTRKIKYKILGKKDFFEQNEVKKLLHLAKESKDFRPADQVLRDLISRYNLMSIYKTSNNPMESNPVENLNDIVKMSVGKGNTMEFLDYLRRLTRARKGSKGLTLTTVHQAKGREWSHVYIVGAHQGMMPHDNGDLNEEARIFFVACSRAAKTLHISFFKNTSMFLLDFQDLIETDMPVMSED